MSARANAESDNFGCPAKHKLPVLRNNDSQMLGMQLKFESKLQVFA